MLTEFPEPPADARGTVAAEVLKSRSIALFQHWRSFPAARASIERALRLNRDVPTLLVGAKLAGVQNNPVLARQLIEEALQKAPNDEESMALCIVASPAW